MAPLMTYRLGEKNIKNLHLLHPIYVPSLFNDLVCETDERLESNVSNLPFVLFINFRCASVRVYTISTRKNYKEGKAKFVSHEFDLNVVVVSVF